MGGSSTIPPKVIHGLVRAFALLALALPARAFVPLSGDPVSSERWDAAPHAQTGGAGLHDGVQVAIEPGLAETLIQATIGDVTPADVAAVRQAIRAAFAGWENPGLAFTIVFDGPAVRGTTVGQEIDVFIVPGTDPAFVGTGAIAGITYSDSVFVPDRLLTNGATLAGMTFSRTDIFLNQTNIALFAELLFPTREQSLAALQRLLMHEIGHAIGLHHPNEFPAANLDTDTDPLDRMVLDPTNPLAALTLSSAVDADAIMSNFPATIPGALLFTALRNDDRGGRDAFYPALPDTICPPVPRNSCRQAGTSVFNVKGKPGHPSRARLGWRWHAGAVARAELGDPRTSRTYGLCAWTGVPATPLVEILVPSHPVKWRQRKDGSFRYDDPAHAASGVARLTLKPGVAGKARLDLRAGGVKVPTPTLGGLAVPLVVQLVDHDSTGCFETRFDAADITANDTTALEAKRSGPARCGNGIVSAPETCDPEALPSGCGLREFCRPDCNGCDPF